MKTSDLLSPPRSDKDQGEIAIRYLELCQLIQMGGYADMKMPRDLSKSEKDVQEAALTCLLVYFSQQGREEPAAQPEKKEEPKP
jgi:hypothetical protein